MDDAACEALLALVIKVGRSEPIDVARMSAADRQTFFRVGDTAASVLDEASSPGAAGRTLDPRLLGDLERATARLVEMGHWVGVYDKGMLLWDQLPHVQSLSRLAVGREDFAVVLAEMEVSYMREKGGLLGNSAREAYDEVHRTEPWSASFDDEYWRNAAAEAVAQITTSSNLAPKLPQAATRTPIASTYRRADNGKKLKVRKGRIVNLEGPGIRGKTVRATLDDGTRVYLSMALMERVTTRYRASDELVVLEEGLLGQAVWVGTREELQRAVEVGDILTA